MWTTDSWEIFTWLVIWVYNLLTSKRAKIIPIVWFKYFLLEFFDFENIIYFDEELVK